ncbi:hypothetical protein OROHE_006683 [Orobanche hederae]
MFGKEAEQLLNLTADDFWQKDQEAGYLFRTHVDRLKARREMLLRIEIQSKIFLKQDGNTILSYTVQSLDCLKTTPPPVCTDASTEQPSSSSGITYLIPAEIVPSTQAPPAHPEHSKDTSKSSRGRTLKAKKLD